MTHALADVLHHWHRAADIGQPVRTVFVDFAKAFENVDHNILISKLREFDLPDVIIRWMYAFLLNRRQRVKIDKTLSEWIPIGAGMPQGSFLAADVYYINR